MKRKWLFSAIVILLYVASVGFHGVTPLFAASNAPQLGYSTYLGGSGNDNPAGDITVDKDGNLIVVGATGSPNFPTKHAMDASYNETGTWTDAFVSKFDPTGRLLWSTFLGTPTRDVFWNVRVDEQGFIYAAGAFGPGAPTTSGVVQGQFSENPPQSGIRWDGYVCKIKPDGSGFVWATYLGMPGVNEGLRGMDIDANGHVYVITGYHGTAWPSQWFTNGFQKTPQGGDDTVVIKLKNDGKQVLSATYIGGSSDESTSPNLTLGPNGDVYLPVRPNLEVNPRLR